MKRLICAIFGHKWEEAHCVFRFPTYVTVDRLQQCRRCLTRVWETETKYVKAGFLDAAT